MQNGGGRWKWKVRWKCFLRCVLEDTPGLKCLYEVTLVEFFEHITFNTLWTGWICQMSRDACGTYDFSKIKNNLDTM